MLKLVVLSAILAAAAGEPSGLAKQLAYPGPLAYSPLPPPGFATIAAPARSVVHAAPFPYSAPLAFSHFIKKRSAPLFAPSAYIASAPLAAAPFATAYSVPLAYSSPGFIPGAPILKAAPLPYVASHLIKKRSALEFHTGILPSTYAAPGSVLVSGYSGHSPYPYSFSVSEQ